MRTIDFYFDPISPYAALAFERLPEALAGRSVAVRYVPILFGAMLKSLEHKGPAEIPGKRDWTYRQVLWQGHRMGIPLDPALVGPDGGGYGGRHGLARLAAAGFAAGGRGGRGAVVSRSEGARADRRSTATG